jgi:aryl-alcohol dehydrogenase-like predicted oxidoreductase
MTGLDVSGSRMARGSSAATGASLTSARRSRQARERGINLFDSAQEYGFGGAEQILGCALPRLDNRREESEPSAVDRL